MTTTANQPGWRFDQTGTREEIEAALRRENFDGSKTALAAKDLAIELIQEIPTIGVRVNMYQFLTTAGYRHTQVGVTEVQLLLPEGEGLRQQRAREMR